MDTEKTPSQNNNEKDEKKPNPEEMGELKDELDKGPSLKGQDSESKQEELAKKEDVGEAAGVAVDDLVYLVEKGDLHRWPEPKEVERIVNVGDKKNPEILVKIVGSDEYHPREKLEVVPELRSFKERFGITPKELVEIDGFPKKQAERRWIFENLTQLTSGWIAAEAEKRQQEALDAEIPDEWKSSTGSLMKNFINASKIFGKTLKEKIKTEHHKASFEQQILEEIQNGGIEEHSAVIKELVDSLDQADFEVNLDEDSDELSFSFASFVDAPEDTSEEDMEAIWQYNEAAERMTQIPDEWQLDTASRKQQKKYQKAKAAYDTARQELLAVKINKFGEDELKATAYLHKKDYAVRMNQLLNTDPAVEKKLQSLGKDPVWWRTWGQSTRKVFNSKNGLRALIGVGGFATRWATSAASFGIASGVAATAAGALRGRIDAKYKLKDKGQRARYGGVEKMDGLEELTDIQNQLDDLNKQIVNTDNEDEKTELRDRRQDIFAKRDKLVKRSDIKQKLYEVGAMVNVDDLTERIQRDINLIKESEDGSNQQQNRLRSLEARIDYTLNKLDQGLVNFGANSSAVASGKLSITELLSDAQTILTLTPSESREDDIFQRWCDEVGLKNEEEVEKARKQFRNKETLKAASISASFFLGGYGLRWLGEGFNWWGSPDAVDINTKEEITGGVITGADSTAASEESTALLGGSAENQVADTSDVMGESPAADSSKAVPPLGGDSSTEVESGKIMGDPAEAAVDSTTVAETDSAAVGEEVRLGGDPSTEADGDRVMGNSPTADEDKVRLGGDSPEAEFEPKAADEVDIEAVPTPPEQIGTAEIVIDEDGEGMIHAIADKLKDDYNLSHEKAMEIGNQIFIKGEQIGGKEELYNLVGKGSSFSLDFGDLTAADLESQSSDDLIKSINFNQDTFDAGESGIKGLELPDSEVAEGNESAKKNPYGRENPVEIVRNIEVASISDNDAMSPQELENWRQGLEDEGIVVTEDSDSQTESVDTESNLNSEQLSGQENINSAENNQTAPFVEEDGLSRAEVTPADIDEVSVSNLRVTITHADLMMEMNPERFSEVIREDMNALNKLLKSYGDNLTMSETIDRIGDEDPRFLTVLERALAADDIDDEPLGASYRQVLTFVRQEVSQLSSSDFSGEMPDYAQKSIRVSKASLQE